MLVKGRVPTDLDAIRRWEWSEMAMLETRLALFSLTLT